MKKPRIATDADGAVNYGVLVESESGKLVLVFGCRNCDEPHTHGWTSASDSKPSHRVSHCRAEGRQDYFIAPIRTGRIAYVVKRTARAVTA